jgi:tetratricopeptide (TPR) repeat protein
MRAWMVLLSAALLAATGTRADAAWYEAKSQHFIIYANENPKVLRDYANRIERYDAAVRHLFGINDPPLTDSGRVKIFVLPSESAVSKLIGLSYAAGMYENRAEGSVAFVPNIPPVFDERLAGLTLDSQTIFFHEYAHHIQLQDASYPMPAWFREGFAEFLSSAEFKKDGSVLFGKAPPGRAWLALQKREMPLEQMLGETYKKLDEQQLGYLYGRGWFLTDYLTVEKSRRGQLTAYLKAIANGTSALDAAKAAFGDFKVLDHELDQYASSYLLGFSVKPQEITVGPIALRQLGAGEAAMMNVHIRSKRGVNTQAAIKVVADARKIAAGYPNDPFVQACLAEAEYDAGDYAASNAAADRALAADPKNVHALIYKGRAQLRLAKANPQAANWEVIRGWFIKANAVDTENAEALALFYDSYGVAVQQPTKNAVDALLYSVELAPQDPRLRFDAVRELLKEKRFDEAKRTFALLAYQPHTSSEWRNRTMQIMELIGSHQGDQALALLSAPTPKVAAASDREPDQAACFTALVC